MPRAVFHSSISGIEPAAWDGLFGSDNPFIRHEFLLAMEECGCACGDTGWAPQHLVLYEGEAAVAAMPVYLKSHSYGEFVFDWGWAGAYESRGLDYYPKLVTAVPFTPSTGPRAGFAPGEDVGRRARELVEAVIGRAAALGCSSWHLLFPERGFVEFVAAPGKETFLQRRDVQFHWFNRDYASFDEFLGALRSSRRKNMKRERREVAAQGVTLERKTGGQIDPEEWAAFCECYTATYRKRSGHEGYLTAAFFDRLLERMGEQLMLVVARRDGEIVASALFLFDSRRLYGRYWGALENIRYVHFEACFYQGIEFCIERGLREFDPGTQGEHKLLRGFEPVETRSLHWIADPQFRAAISGFLERERRSVRAYGREAEAYLPFRSGGPDAP